MFTSLGVVSSTDRKLQRHLFSLTAETTEALHFSQWWLLEGQSQDKREDATPLALHRCLTQKHLGKDGRPYLPEEMQSRRGIGLAQEGVGIIYNMGCIVEETSASRTAYDWGDIQQEELLADDAMKRRPDEKKRCSRLPKHSTATPAVHGQWRVERHRSTLVTDMTVRQDSLVV